MPRQTGEDMMNLKEGAAFLYERMLPSHRTMVVHCLF